MQQKDAIEMTSTIRFPYCVVLLLEELKLSVDLSVNINGRTSLGSGTYFKKKRSSVGWLPCDSKVVKV